MLRKATLRTALAATLLLTSASAWSYEQDLAASYAGLFEPVAGAAAGKALHLMKPDAFVDQIKQGKAFVMLDVRTPAEAQIYGAALPGSMAIPLNELFKAENLDRLPTDKPIVVVCKSGTRAAVAGTALRHVGFDNVMILKGGFKALNDYLDAKTANTPPPAPAAATK